MQTCNASYITETDHDKALHDARQSHTHSDLTHSLIHSTWSATYVPMGAPAATPSRAAPPRSLPLRVAQTAQPTST
jgi:hypothetical protein